MRWEQAIGVELFNRQVTPLQLSEQGKNIPFADSADPVATVREQPCTNSVVAAITRNAKLK
ncbi:hypothetical protein ACVXHB_01220 [Escherichia coli]